MRKNKRGVINMTTTTLERLEKKVVQNRNKNIDRIKSFENKLKSRGLRSGRIRPRSSTEAKILSKFKRK